MGRVPGGFAHKAATVPQQELGQLLAGDPLGAFGVVAGSFQVADGLGGLVGDMDLGQVSGAVKVGQFGGVTAVGFDAASGLDGDQRRSDDDALPSGGFELTSQAEACGSGFVAAGHRGLWSETSENFGQGSEVVRDGGQDFGVDAALVGNGDDNGVLVNVETDVSHCVRIGHGPVPPGIGSVLFATSEQCNPRWRE